MVEMTKGHLGMKILFVPQAVSREFICEECQNSTLNKLESMLEILQTDTKQGTVTPTEIADNILNIMGKEDSLLPLGEHVNDCMFQSSTASNKSFHRACLSLSGGQWVLLLLISSQVHSEA